jgi:hypothetical protein
MNKKLLFFGGLSILSFSALLAGDHKMAQLVNKAEAKLTGIRFKDTTGTPFTKQWKARILISFSVWNPTKIKFPLTLFSITPIVDGVKTTNLLASPRKFIIESDYNEYKNIMFEVPLTLGNYRLIKNLSNPQVEINAKVYSMPFTFTHNFNKI